MPMSSRYRSIGLRLTPHDIEAIDAERGLIPREAWLRHLIDIGREHANSSPGAQRRQDTSRRAAQSPSGQRENRADAFRNATQGKRT